MEIAAWELLVIGLLIVFSILSKAVLERLGLPDLLGYLLIGVGLSLLHHVWPTALSADARLLTFLAQIGVVTLLFRIGLECKIEHLWKRLPGATWIWIVNVSVSLGVVLATCLALLAWPLLPSLFVAVALTATGIGVSVHVWRNSEQLGSAKGALMLDVAELDDLLGVVLLAVLTALAPELRSGWSADLLVPTVLTLGSTVGKLGMLALGGLLFARYLEYPLTHWLNDLQPRPDTMISVLGIGLVVAGLTALLGFSAAIGGFFAGLIFSGDPLSVKIDASFDSVHDLFVPFFFIFVGYSVDLSVLAGTLGPVLLLLCAAVLGKGLGSFLPVAQQLRPTSALVFAVALIPRSEITIIVMERGLDLGVVSQETFGVVVAVVALTMVGVPLVLRGLLPTSA
jgi:Kef-type K+ transport system membrane component KefB